MHIEVGEQKDSTARIRNSEQNVMLKPWKSIAELDKHQRQKTPNRMVILLRKPRSKMSTWFIAEFKTVSILQSKAGAW